jgi:hypothetical protein
LFQQTRFPEIPVRKGVAVEALGGIFPDGRPCGSIKKIGVICRPILPDIDPYGITALKILLHRHFFTVPESHLTTAKYAVMRYFYVQIITISDIFHLIELFAEIYHLLPILSFR